MATRLCRSAEVVVEARPRLVGDQLELDVLALGKAEELVRAGTEVLGQRVDGRARAVDRHGVRLAPGHQPLGQRTGAGQHLVEPAVGVDQDLLVDPGGRTP